MVAPQPLTWADTIDDHRTVGLGLDGRRELSDDRVVMPKRMSGRSSLGHLRLVAPPAPPPAPRPEQRWIERSVRWDDNVLHVSHAGPEAVDAPLPSPWQEALDRIAPMRSPFAIDEEGPAIVLPLGAELRVIDGRGRRLDARAALRAGWLLADAQGLRCKLGKVASVEVKLGAQTLSVAACDPPPELPRAGRPMSRWMMALFALALALDVLLSLAIWRVRG